MSIKSIIGSCIIFSLLALSACGQKGPLEHTEATKAKIAAEQAAREEAIIQQEAADQEAPSEDAGKQL